VREKVFVHNNAQIMERKMWQFILGSTGFILYFIYDINSVRMKNAVLQKFFAAGSILVVVSLIAELYAAWGSCQRKIGTMTGFGLGGFLFLCLLIYTLFFALPFEETYCEENKLRAAYTEGMYGLCRHPGVLWFAGAYLCMWGMVGGWKHGIYFLLMIFWNYLYIIFQDLWTFPRTFFNYKEYQQSTPFLIPNRKSIRVCLRTIRKND
jgi:protein-S-isoprenylcysteine O-methyltransferase Ste14